MIGTAMAGIIAALAAGGSAATGAALQSRAVGKAAKLQTDSATRAAEIQAAADREAMNYAKEVEATRKAEFDKTQALNLDQYNQRERRMTPYRDLGEQGVTLLSHLVRPGSGSDYLPPPRTLNTLVGG
jgi:hypothetical protein